MLANDAMNISAMHRDYDGYLGAGPLARERTVAAVVISGLEKYWIFYTITY